MMPARLNFPRAPGFARLRALARKLVPICLAGLGVMLFASCQSAQPLVEPMVARFYLEARPGEAGVAVQLPRSKVRIAVTPKPVLVEYDVANVNMAKVDLGWCLVFNFNPAAARELYRMSVAARDRRLVLTLNNEAVAAHRLDQAVTGTTLVIFLEVPNEALPQVADRIRRTSQGLQERAR